MENLSVITSSSLNVLVRHLAHDLRDCDGDPLRRETVVIQSNGMSRWISIEVACQNGVCANMDYRFPNALIDDIFRLTLPELFNAPPTTTETLCWRIMTLLPGLMDRPGFEPVRDYCRSSMDDRSLYQLSRKIADCFDQYTIYRPQQVLQWDAGQGSGWQPELWRAVFKEGNGRSHRAALLVSFRRRIGDRNLPVPAGLPAKIRLFGISYLPPFHLEVLSILASVIRVSVYLFNPCGEYWGDLVSNRRLPLLALQHGVTPDEAAEYYETGNPLLSSLGTMGQEFFNLLLDYGVESENLDDAQALKQPATMLQLIQSDILKMRDRSKGDRSAVSEQDSSIHINACHGPLREMQVLYDSLLRLFERHPDLEPRQIVVMIPDIDAYAPYINAVFGTIISGRAEIPYTIADRSQGAENPDIVAFLKILQIPSGRFSINQVLELLESGAVMQRFDISVEEIAIIRKWLIATRVRWGIDADSRAEQGFPPYPDNSWQSAIDRLLLGYAMPPEGNRLFQGILPYGSSEGSKSKTLGKLIAFFQKLRESANLLTPNRDLTGWADVLSSVTTSMLSPTDSSTNSLRPIFEALQQLREEQALSGFSAPVSLKVLFSTLVTRLEKPGASFGFMSGRVTFCAMLPMRSIPFRVICMAGMNEGVFPRISYQPGFSLLNGKRLRGDRSLRDEDRYLFLEALMSAGEQLLISYTGLNCRDNSELPPAVVVSELLDYIDASFCSAGDGMSIMPQIVTQHRLHSFSEAYFTHDQQPPWFSYAFPEYRALTARQLRGTSRLPFCTAPLPLVDQEAACVELHSLLRFFFNPAAFFLAMRLGVRPDRLEAELEESESFQIDSLVNYHLKQDISSALLAGETEAGIYEVSRAASLLPPLAAGRLEYERSAAEAREFYGRVAEQLGEELPPFDFSLKVAEFSLTGRITGIRSGNHVRYRCAGLKGKDILSIWIEHLILNLSALPGLPRTSTLIGRDEHMHFMAMDNAASRLAELLRIYMRGATEPLRFFPDSSFRMQSKGLDAARQSWEGNSFTGVPGECEEPAFKICFRGVNPLDEDFSRLAETVYAPLLAAVTAEQAGRPDSSAFPSAPP